MATITLEPRDIPDEDMARLEVGLLVRHKMPQVPILKDGKPTGETEDKYTLVELLGEVAWTYLMREVDRGNGLIAKRQVDRIIATKVR